MKIYHHAFLSRHSFQFSRIIIGNMASLTTAPFEHKMEELFSDKKILARISDVEPACHVIGYQHLGISVSNMSAAIDFYSKIGFALKDEGSPAVLQNRGGLELHLFLCDRGIEDDKNILMDFPANKYPGHTHAAFTVPNVPNTQAFLESEGLTISGERKRGDRLYAIFARDLDRTTLEFEKNHGDPEDVVINRDSIGYPQGIDHIGIRVAQPDLRWSWYAEKLGFVYNVGRYEANPDPLKNFPPWIQRTVSGCDINLIINANELVSENILLAGGVRPGIVYACFTVADIDSAEQRLREQGVIVARERDLAGVLTFFLSFVMIALFFDF